MRPGAGYAVGVAGVSIRRAAPGDAAALVALARSIAAEPGAWLLTDATWRSAADERRYLRAVRSSPHAAVLVAVTPCGELVGRLSIARDQHPSSPHVADLGIMVAETERRQGIGRALLAAAADWARDVGISKLELHVFPHNTAAIALYEGLGYEREGVRCAHYVRAGELVDVVVMALQLGGGGAPAARPAPR